MLASGPQARAVVLRPSASGGCWGGNRWVYTASRRRGGGRSDHRQKGQYMLIAEIFLFGFVSFLSFTSAHHMSRNLGFRDRVKPPWDYLTGVVLLGAVYGGLLGWWALGGRAIGGWTALAGFSAVTCGAGLAVGLAYALEGVMAKWRRLEEGSRRKTAQIDALLRERGDGHRQPGIGGEAAGAAATLLDGVEDWDRKPN